MFCHDCHLKYSQVNDDPSIYLVEQADIGPHLPHAFSSLAGYYDNTFRFMVQEKLEQLQKAMMPSDEMQEGVVERVQAGLYT